MSVWSEQSDECLFKGLTQISNVRKCNVCLEIRVFLQTDLCGNCAPTFQLRGGTLPLTIATPAKLSSPMPRCQVMLWCVVGELLRNQR